MLRPARPGDEPRLAACLARHADMSMFLRANLAAHGLGERIHPRGTAYWLAEEHGAVTAVFGLSNAGFALVAAPGAAPGLYAEFARAIAGRRLAGLVGEAGEGTALKAVLRLEGGHWALDRVETFFALDLAQLRLPEAPGRLRPVAEADLGWLAGWHLTYLTETLGATDTAATRDRVAHDLAAWPGNDDVRLYEVAGVPVAKTEFNARLPDRVQLGGVYTPAEHRGRGHARAAVALHLAEARARGVPRAVLAASGEAAGRAYRAVGFEPVGAQLLAVLAEPALVLGAAP